MCLTLKRNLKTYCNFFSTVFELVAEETASFRQKLAGLIAHGAAENDAVLEAWSATVATGCFRISFSDVANRR